MTTKIIYNKCLGYTRQGAKLQKVEKIVKDLRYDNKHIDLIDHTEATAQNPFIKIVLDGVVYFELPERLPQINLND